MSIRCEKDTFCLSQGILNAYTNLRSIHILGRMRLEHKGLSHGLMKCPPDTSLPTLRVGRPFESHHPPHKKTVHSDSFYEGKDLF